MMKNMRKLNHRISNPADYILSSRELEMFIHPSRHKIKSLTTKQQWKFYRIVSSHISREELESQKTR
jgi:hypothetical protein